ncbi:MAG: type IV pilus inner membrane component PilO [Burkholderiales bacterium]
MTLDELKNLDFSNINPNDPGSWPAAVKAASLALLFLVLLGGGYYFAWSDQLDSLKTAEAEEVKLRETFLDKKKQAINLDLYRQQLKDIEQSFGALLRQLPNKKEMDALVTDINQAGLGRGLEFQLFRPAQNETMSEFYAELPITISVTGSYHDFGAFASDIAQLPRIVTLADISITPGKGDRLSMNATAKTYRYLDDNEIAARKKPAKDKKK